LVRSIFLIIALWTRDEPEPFSTQPLSAEEAKVYGDFYPAHFEKNLTAVIELAKSRDRRVFLLNFADVVTESATPDEQRRARFPRGMGRRLHKYLALKKSYRAALRTAAEKTDTPILDIASLFMDTESRNVFTDTIHFTPEGAERIAAYVAKHINGRPQSMAGTSQ
jgi:lysophospholipase L1-like esterase